MDDEAVIISLLEYAFTKAGFSVVAAESAEAALEVLKKEHIQVMFLDLNLPEMNGVELCRRIKKDQPMSLVFAVTGYSSLFELVGCRDAGFDDYFKKPVDIKALIKTATEAFEKMERRFQASRTGARRSKSICGHITAAGDDRCRFCSM